MMVASILLASLGLTMLATPLPNRPVPSPRQLAWHRLETYAFVHFGPNTFSGVEWGSGSEDPNSFSPSRLDCRQWTRVFRQAGLKGVIVTAKHHDGYCLWPTAQSRHSVKFSRWRQGKGDMLRELADACRKDGLKLGVYLSPWDRNHPAYGTPAYNDVFVAMLTEVLTQYGPIFEVWFDGANGEGPNGKRQVYDWPRFVDTVRRFQPNAVIFSDAGPDVRWIGNEEGYADSTHWAMLRRDEFQPGTPRYKELTQGHSDGTHWLPGECDVSIRPGWFYRASEDEKVKSVAKLVDIYYGSVGQGASLLLNVPPDASGRIHSIDAARLLAWRKVLRQTFRRDLARSSRVLEGGEVALRAIDGKTNTYWEGSEPRSSLAIQWPNPVRFDRVMLQEAIRFGQQVDEFLVEARIDGAWREVAEGTTIGAKRILRLPDVEADALRVTIRKSFGSPKLSTLGVFHAPSTLEADGQELPSR